MTRYLIWWPLAAVVVQLVMPLAWIFTIALSVAAVVFLVLHKEISTSWKLTIAAMWVVSVAGLVYWFAAFSAQIDAADADIVAPAWTQVSWLALVGSPVVLVVASILVRKSALSAHP